MNKQRRLFLKSAGAVSALLLGFPYLRASTKPISPVPEDSAGNPRQSLGRVKDFVQAGHRNLDTVKNMLSEEPSLLNARWDWGGGDWESAIEGASHMGRQDIVRYLLQRGARANPLSYAMIGSFDVVAAQLSIAPETSRLRGPHGITLLFHVAIGGSIKLASLVVPALGEEGAVQCNAALHGAVRFGNAEMVEWLVENGVSDLNTKNVFERTPLDEALLRSDSKMISVLKAAGARNS